MKILLCTPSRGSHATLQSVIVSSRALASGAHSLHYAISVDEDDTATQEMLAALKAQIGHISVLNGPRPRALGQTHNKLIHMAPFDVCVIITDRTFFLTPRWDRIVADAVTKVPHGVFWMTHPDLPTSCIFPVLTRRWLEAAGTVFTDYFPFWFDDTWIAEMWLFVTGSAPLMLPAQIFRDAHKTKRLRDLDFWYRFFFALRTERMARAREMTARLGLPAVNMDPIRRQLEQNDAALLKRVPQIEAEYGVPGTAPDASYLEAKARAEGLLANLGQPPFAA